MGISGLLPFLRKKCPRAFRRVAVKDFSGTRAAIDATLMCYSLLAKGFTTAVNDLPADKLMADPLFTEEEAGAILLGAMNQIKWISLKFLKGGVTPVFVFDGDAVPEKASHAHKNRAARRSQIAEKISALRSQIADAGGVGLGDDALRLMETGEQKLSVTDDVIALRALLKQATHFNPKGDAAKIRAFVSNTLKLPCVTAPDEAERMCARMASSGIASFSYTADSDSLAFGAPVLAIDFSPDGWMDCVVLSLVLEGLQLTQHQFVDLCILFGCDFNCSLPGIGPVRAWGMIDSARKSNRSAKRLIEIALGTVKSDKITQSCITALNAERCREIFLGTYTLPLPLTVDMELDDSEDALISSAVATCPCANNVTFVGDDETSSLKKIYQNYAFDMSTYTPVTMNI